MSVFKGILVLVLCAAVPLRVTAAPAAAGADHPWLDPALSPDERARLAVRAMTKQEKLALVFGYFGSVMPGKHYQPPRGALMGSAGYVPGIARLGLPAQWITDAGLGVATQRASTDAYRERTALPSGLAAAAGWNRELAERSGAMIGAEARESGFNVLLGPGVDLVREARGGRDFEYAGEDPLLAGTIAGAEIRGIQSQHVIAVLKHFAFNDQETGRTVLSAVIGRAQARESDLLAFELSIELGHPGAVMCAYNRFNGIYGCQNHWLLSEVLKGDWGFPGYVMSDWGAVHSTVGSALAGLDQESAAVFDRKPYFGAALKEAVAAGSVPESRLDEMARRILRPMFAVGLVDHPIDPQASIDFAADTAVAEADEEQGIVLLKDAGGILPLARTVKHLLVIGGHADRGVISGGGSSTVFPVAGNAVAGVGPSGWPGPVVYLPSSPLGAIMGQAPQARIRYLSGTDIAQAVRAAKWADRVIVFATQWAAESRDVSLSLPGEQDRLIGAVARANPHTVVVLETGGPVLMPWLSGAAGVLEAWYPGSGGGEAIARMLFGTVDPSGHLPVSFPASLGQLPYPRLPGAEVPADRPFDIDYRAGAAVGYKWYQSHHLKPLFAFGYGLSYTRFGYSALAARVEAGKLAVSFRVSNFGTRSGWAVPQVYVGPETSWQKLGWEAPRRLGGWSKVQLAPGASRTVTLSVDPRLLATFDEASERWRRAAGTYEIWLGGSSADLERSTEVQLPAWYRGAHYICGPAVSVTMTTDDRTRRFEPVAGVTFGPLRPGPGAVAIDDSRTYQKVEGFGAAWTDSAAYLLHEVASPGARARVMSDLFTRNGHGIGLSFMRIPMGASDIARTGYSYDDMPAGETDPTLAHFSIAHDERDIIPLIRQSLALNPRMTLMANPWSPPGWMKSSGRMIGGTLRPEYYGAFARYFVKFLQAYRRSGIPVRYISLQNEPLYLPTDYPGMSMPAATQLVVLRDSVLPALRAADLDTEILVYDHNWDRPDYPETVLADPAIRASGQVAGVAWHGYGGTPAAQTLVQNKYPQFGQYETEHSGGTWVADQVRSDFEEIIQVLRNGGRSYVKWSLALDQNLGPHDGGCGTCTPIVTVNSKTGAVTEDIEYATLGQFSRFILPGATRVYSSNAGGIESVALINPDGGHVLVAFNDTGRARRTARSWR